ncbi:MAG: carboxypeptidase regulatory-like domain-containing protein [Porphyrobacter sp. IPPAS B-1204]|nr:MAG: carboxypeptidase regulatory-like domain-containing protein [Porphyrobacter sp. IPPAS B-1204]
MTDLKVAFPNPCDEPWGAMARRGCNRHCAACDTIIHDLEHLTFEDAERLLESASDVCVRAKVGRDGVISLKPSDTGSGRRLLAAAGATLALATAACQTVPDRNEARYQITGKFSWKEYYYSAELTSQDGRKWPKRREPGTGRFIFDNLPPGTYELSTQGFCEGRQVLETITITDASAEVTKTGPDLEDGCIIIGVMVPAEPLRSG